MKELRKHPVSAIVVIIAVIGAGGLDAVGKVFTGETILSWIFGNNWFEKFTNSPLSWTISVGMGAAGVWWIGWRAVLEERRQNELICSREAAWVDRVCETQRTASIAPNLMAEFFVRERSVWLLENSLGSLENAIDSYAEYLTKSYKERDEPLLCRPEDNHLGSRAKDVARAIDIFSEHPCIDIPRDWIVKTPIPYFDRSEFKREYPFCPRDNADFIAQHEDNIRNYQAYLRKAKIRVGDLRENLNELAHRVEQHRREAEDLLLP